MKTRKIAMAVHAHPDDIEYMMAGTLLLLGQAGYELHYMNVASGSCGSLEYSAEELRAIREAESREAAGVLGATFHPSLRDDLEVFYDLETLREMTAVIRGISPTILLVPSPQDYMEDHMNVCRLAVSAAFARGMQNFDTSPPSDHVDGEVCVYHCMPHGLTDALRNPIVPDAVVDTTSVHSRKLEALAKHASQGVWLEKSQSMPSYLTAMETFSSRVGAMVGTFSHGEGWRRHLHYGFGEESWDPMADALGQNFHIIDNQK